MIASQIAKGGFFNAQIQFAFLYPNSVDKHCRASLLYIDNQAMFVAQWSRETWDRVLTTYLGIAFFLYPYRLSDVQGLKKTVQVLDIFSIGRHCQGPWTLMAECVGGRPLLPIWYVLVIRLFMCKQGSTLHCRHIQSQFVYKHKKCSIYLECGILGFIVGW